MRTLIEQTTRVPDADLMAALGVGQRPKPRGRKWAVLAIVLALIAGGGGYVWNRFLRQKPIQFETAESKRGDLTVTVTATGTLKPVNMVEVGAEISGRIEKVHVDFNQHVKQGEALAEMDTRQLRAQVERSEASLQVAEAALQLSEATLVEARQTASRIESLANENLLSTQELDAARAALARAEASVASSKAQVTVSKAGLNSDRTNLEKTVIRSSIDGFVIARQVEPGQTVASSFQTPLLFKLAEDLARMELSVDVDEADMGLVKEKQSATFTVDAHPGRQFPARITSLRNDPHTVQGVVSYEAVLTVDNSEGLLRPGMTATASITTDKRTNVLLIPNSALRFTPPNAQPPKPTFVDPKFKTVREGFVWVLRDGKPVALTTKKGLSDGKFTEVLDGEIQPGQTLLVDVLEKKKDV